MAEMRAVSRVHAKALFKRVEEWAADLRTDGPAETSATTLAPRIQAEMAEPLGVEAVQVYAKRRGQYQLLETLGAKAPDLSKEVQHRLSGTGGEAGIMELPWTGFLQGALVGLFPVARDVSVLLALRFAERNHAEVEDLGVTVMALHHALTSHFRDRELQGIWSEAKAIQTSLLPTGPFRFANYDIAVKAVSAQSVGGDIYDFLPLDAETMALAVGDSSGHGLPAALQARDVITGLRMGAARDYRISNTVAKLNRVVHRGGLVARFISLFFAELEANGNLFYINAGHPPPLICRGGRVEELSVGGVVLGPLPDAHYKQGFTHLDRGGALLLYSDGASERADPAGNEFGTERLGVWLREHPDLAAGPAVEALYEDLSRFGGDAPFDDDLTLVLVRRPR